MASYNDYVGSHNTRYCIRHVSTSQNIAGNYSVLKFRAIMDVTTSYISWTRGSATLHFNSYPLANKYARGNHVIGDVDVIVNHESDGTFPGCTIGGGISTTFGMNGNCSITLSRGEIGTIPRSSSIGNVDFSNFWNTFRVSYTKYYSGFTCKLRVSIPAVEMLQTFDRYVSSSDVTFSASVQDKIMNKLITTDSIKLGFVIETWNGASKIGESTESEITIHKPMVNQITSINNFDIDSGFDIITTKSYQKYTSSISVVVAGVNVFNESNISDNYKVVFSSVQLKKIYEIMKTVNSEKFTVNIISYYGDIEVGSNFKNVIGTITDATPTFKGFEWETINNLTLHDNQTIIKGKSNVRVTIQQATAYKGATISYYQVSIGNAISKVTTLDVVLNNCDSNIIVVYAVDSRGNATNKQMICSKYIKYESISFETLNYERGSGGIGNDVTIEFNGTMFNDDFGLQKNNLMTTYFFKEVNANEYTQGTTNITPTVNSKYSNKVSIRGDLGANGFTIDKNFNLKVVVSDCLSSCSRELVIAKGMPMMAMHSEGVAYGGFYDKEIGGSLQVYDYMTQNGFDVLDTSTGIAKDANVTAKLSLKEGYPGFDNASNGYFRTPPNGLLPNVPGGISNIGNSAWRFVFGYFNNLDVLGSVTSNTVYTDNWYRSRGKTGWFNETYLGGICMEDDVYVRVYGDKAFWCDRAIYMGGMRCMRTSDSNIDSMRWGNESHTYIHVDTVQGSFGINVWASDRSLKEHIKNTEIKYALDKVSQLKHVEFDWKDGGEKCELGYVADDIEKVLPCLIHNVKQKDGTSLRHINHTALIPLVTMGVQELIQENKYLWEFNNAVVDEVCILKERLDKLESLVTKLLEEKGT